jgi:hypothetical protein
MKPDKFDEAIRRKLEGIQPGFQEEDWGKFKAYQSTQIPALRLYNDMGVR